MRSIPACAGEPGACTSRSRTMKVYPRVCGGTLTGPSRDGWGRGLSPRVRGNRAAGVGASGMSGSIPACAGEPARRGRRRFVAGVYPRVCGGTVRTPVLRGVKAGLSPRVRGNRQLAGIAGAGLRSIPACAGEPLSGSKGGASRRVYPRVCGGTVTLMAWFRTAAGLSPRVRGNLPSVRGLKAAARSIPACAGEPRRSTGWCTLRWVYPRVCGGTMISARRQMARAGLSPRVRGNPACLSSWLAGNGSIPACAGEPGKVAPLGAVVAVYPRVCGGTGIRNGYRYRYRGLSPRVRGNPR